MTASASLKGEGTADSGTSPTGQRRSMASSAPSHVQQAVPSSPGTSRSAPRDFGPWRVARPGRILGIMGTRRVVEALTRETCLDLLSRAEIGRVVLTSHALPTAMPVNYAFDGTDIVFRT